MNIEMTLEQRELYKSIINLWQRLCNLHQSLLEVTTEEYTSLLSSDLEKTAEILETKKNLIKEIAKEDLIRQKLVSEILGPETLADGYKFSDLKTFFNKFEIESKGNHLNNFNLILLDTINKIKAQNKKNRFFINRAMISLDGLKLPSNINPNHSLYNKNGKKLKKLDVKGV